MAFFEFPHTRTYDSDLAWLIKVYKILTGKVNNIEQTIEDTINEALQGEELKQLITQMIAEALPLNVKYPPAESGLTPAVGDGETDDTTALQAMIAYANANNMPMIFPAGVYRVTGLNVNVDTVFQGFDATLMLAPVSAKPLITLTADLATSGLTLNGNLGGQTTAQDVINIMNGSFAITNTTIKGGKSCIEGTLVGDSMIGDSYLRNFQEYGIHAEGSGSFTASNVVVPSVPSGGVMRFMLIDCDNCTVSNFSSHVPITVGFEITGNNNAITANIPNAETPVNDSGTGNTWTITGKDEKRYFDGSGSLSYQNLQESVEGDYTQNVGDFEGTASGHYAFNGADVELNPTNPLTYNKIPQSMGSYFKYVPFKLSNGTVYNVLVASDNTENLSSGIFENIKDYGAVGDGETDDTAAFNTALSASRRIFIPSGTYMVSGCEIPNDTVIIGTEKPVIKLINNSNRSAFSAIQIGAHDIYLYGLEIDGNYENQSGFSGTPNDSYSLIFIMNATRVSIDNCIIHDGILNNIFIQNSKLCNISRCETYGANYAGGIILTYNSNPMYSNILYNYCHDNNKDGILCTGEKCLIAGNVCIHNGLMLHDPEETEPSCGIYLDEYSSYNIITNNYCENNSFSGIELSGSNNSIVSNNRLVDNLCNGIYLGEGSYNIITGNQCIGNRGEREEDYYGGICIRDTTNSGKCRYNTVSNNIINCGNFSKYAFSCINAQYNIFLGNTVSGYKTNAQNINDPASNTIISPYNYCQLSYTELYQYSFSDVIAVWNNQGSSNPMQLQTTNPLQLKKTNGEWQELAVGAFTSNGLAMFTDQLLIPTKVGVYNDGMIYVDRTGIHVYVDGSIHNIAFTN